MENPRTLIESIRPRARPTNTSPTNASVARPQSATPSANQARSGTLGTNGGVVSRIFGIGRNAQRQRQQAQNSGYIAYENAEVGARVRMVPDTSAGAMAARHNMAQIYGEDAVPQDFAMRGVIEVMDPETGEYVPVTGNRRGVPDMDTQIAALQSWSQTGQIGNFSNPEAQAAIDGSGGAGTSSPAGTPGGAAPTAPAGVVAPGQSARPQARPEVQGPNVELPIVFPDVFTPLPGSALEAMVDPSGPTIARAEALGLDGPQSGQPVAQTLIMQPFAPVAQQSSGVVQSSPNDLLMGANSPLAYIGPRRTAPQMQAAPQQSMMPLIITGY